MFDEARISDLVSFVWRPHETAREGDFQVMRALPTLFDLPAPFDLPRLCFGWRYRAGELVFFVENQRQYDLAQVKWELGGTQAQYTLFFTLMRSRADFETVAAGAALEPRPPIITETKTFSQAEFQEYLESVRWLLHVQDFERAFKTYDLDAMRFGLGSSAVLVVQLIKRDFHLSVRPLEFNRHNNNTIFLGEISETFENLSTTERFRLMLGLRLRVENLFNQRRVRFSLELKRTAGPAAIAAVAPVVGSLEWDLRTITTRELHSVLSSVVNPLVESRGTERLSIEEPDFSTTTQDFSEEQLLIGCRALLTNFRTQLHAGMAFYSGAAIRSLLTDFRSFAERSAKRSKPSMSSECQLCHSVPAAQQCGRCKVVLCADEICVRVAKLMLAVH